MLLRYNRPSGSCFCGGLDKLCKEGRLNEALQTVNLMKEQELCVSPNFFYCLLQFCIKKEDLAAGRELHGLIIRSGFESNTFLGSHLIRMFTICESLSEADKVFGKLAEQNVFTWSAIISAHAKLGRSEHAIDLYHQMHESNVNPDGHIFVIVLKTCTSKGFLTLGKIIHAHILESGCLWDEFIGSTLIDMYAKCGSLSDARKVFNDMQNRDVVTWGAIIAGYAHHGNGQEVIQLFKQMQKEGMKLNQVSLLSILKACTIIASLEHSKLIHIYIIESGFERDEYVGNALIDMYAKCGSMESACRVFDGLLKRDSVAWGAMISGYAQSGHGQEAFQVFQQMQLEGTEPNPITFVSIMKACSSVAFLGQAKVIHVYIIANGFEANQFVASTLLDVYTKCGNLNDAHSVFDRLPKQDLVTWSAMIAGCAQHGYVEESLRLFELMQQDGTKPDKVTLLSILKACSSLEDPRQGMLIHGQIVEGGYELEVVVGNALIDMYAKCGNLKDALLIFNRVPIHNVVTWTAIVDGYTQHKHGQEALQFFLQMQEEGVASNSITYVSVLKACSNLATLNQGKMIHACIVVNGFESDVCVGTALINMYAKCGSLVDAHPVFYRLPKEDAVLWSSMIAGLVENGYNQVALQYFQLMQQEGVNPNQVTFVCILKACVSIAALEHGKRVHVCIIESGFECDDVVANTIIDMYAKGGSLDYAHKIFERLPNQDVVTWTELISAYAEWGHVQEAVELYKKMQHQGMEPNQVTFVNIIKACSNLASLDAGMMIHTHIIRTGLEWDESICNTLINMYAKCGKLEDAYWVFDKLPNLDVVAWSIIIAGYAQHGHSLEAFKLFQQIIREGMKPDQIVLVCALKGCRHIAALDVGIFIHTAMIESGSEPNMYVCSSLISMYANCGMLGDACNVFDRMTKRNVVTWNAMISGCAQHSNYKLACQYFEGMQRAGFEPDGVTYTCLLSACSHVGLVKQGRGHFESILEGNGLLSRQNHFNLMIDLLGRTGHLNEAEVLLQTMPFKPSIESWLSLLSHCRTHGNVDLARRCFDQFATANSRNSAGYVLMSTIYAFTGMQDEALKVEKIRKCAKAWKKPGKAFIESDNMVQDFIVGGKSHPSSVDIYAKLQRLSVPMKVEGYMPSLELVPCLKDISYMQRYENEECS